MPLEEVRVSMSIPLLIGQHALTDQLEEGEREGGGGGGRAGAHYEM